MDNVLIVALCAYTIVTALRFAVARYDDRIGLRSSTKFVLLLIAAGFVSAWLNDFTLSRERVLEGIAGAGLATIVHRTHRWLGAMGDLYRLHVVNGARRR